MPDAAHPRTPPTAATTATPGIAGSPDRPVLIRVASLLSPYRAQLLLVAGIVAVSAALTSVAPFLTRAVFDDALFPGTADGGPATSGPHLTLLYWLVAGMVALPLVNALLGVGQTYLTTKVGNGAMADLRVGLFSHLESMELAFFTSARTGDIQSRLANDVSSVRNILTSTATTILQNVVTVVAAFISMVLLSWQLTLVTLVLMPVFVVVQAKVAKRRKALQKQTQESLSELTAITEESLGVSGVLLAKVFNRAGTEVERYRRQNLAQTRLQLKNAMTGQTFFSIVSTFFGMTPAIVYLIAGLLLNRGTLVGGTVVTAGTIVAFTTLQSRLQMPLVQLMRVTLDVQTSMAVFARLFEYLDMEPAIRDKAGAQVLAKEEVRGEVELRGVWFRYPAPRAEAAPSGTATETGAREVRTRSDNRYRALDVPVTTTLADAAGGNVLPPLSAPDLAPAVPVFDDPFPRRRFRGTERYEMAPAEVMDAREEARAARRAARDARNASPEAQAEEAAARAAAGAGAVMDIAAGTAAGTAMDTAAGAVVGEPEPLPEARKYLDIDVTDLSQVGEDLDADGRISDGEKWALADLSLTVRPGQLAALVGPSGSGKTTLTYLIPRLHEATRGQVLIDGHDVKDVTMSSLADVVGMVTQEPYLFNATITENLRYAREEVTDAEIVEACKAANIHDRIMSFADGYETVTGERGFRLSGGEKQRISIARVLIKNPKVLILDEATSALDTATERLVQEALERAMERRTTFAIAHRLSTIMNADVIFGVADGRLVEHGTHDELLARRGLYARLYQEQFGGGDVEARVADAVHYTDGTTVPREPATHRRPDMAV